MNDTQYLRHVKEEEISATPTLCAEGLVTRSPENVQGACLDPRVSLSSKPEESQLGQDSGLHCSTPDFHGHNTIIAIEKSFKDEEYIYVSILFSFSSLNLQTFIL